MSSTTIWSAKRWTAHRCWVRIRAFYLVDLGTLNKRSRLLAAASGPAVFANDSDRLARDIMSIQGVFL